MGAHGGRSDNELPPSPAHRSPVLGWLPVCTHGGCGPRGENMGTDVGRCAYKHRCACVCMLGSRVHGWESRNTWGMSVQAKLCTCNRLM